MDLFVNNSLITGDSESNDNLSESVEDFKKIAAVMGRRKDAVRLLSLLQWFIKCSTVEKTNYMVRLASELNLDDLMDVIKPIKLFVGKAFMLSEASNGTMCIDDKVLIDDNINLDPKILHDVQENDFMWFYNLERVDQVEVILGMTKILGMGGCRKLYQRLVSVYRSKPVEDADQTAADIGANTAPKAGDADHDAGAEADYAAAGDVHEDVLRLHANWADLIAKYRYEVFGKPSDKQPRKTKQKPDAKKKLQPKSGDKQRLDDLQLLPLFISWRILSYLDTKTLNTVQQVNSYWSFAAGQVLAERTARVNLSKTVSKMMEHLPSSPAAASHHPQPSNTADSRAAATRCDRRLLRLFERGTAIAALRPPPPPTDLNYNSLLQDVFDRANLDYGSFVLPTDGLCVFPRCAPAVVLGDEEQMPEALLVAVECATQWLEGQPGGLVPKRHIFERQVANVPIGRKVEASTTRQSLESMTDFPVSTMFMAPSDSIDAQPSAMNTEGFYQTSDAPLVAIQSSSTSGQQQQPWYSTITVVSDKPQKSVDVLSDLTSTMRMKVVPSSLSGRSSADGHRMADAETVLKNFEQRINSYIPRGKKAPMDDNNNT